MRARVDLDDRGGVPRLFLSGWPPGHDIVYVFWSVAMAYLRIAIHPGIFEHPFEWRSPAGNLAPLLGRAHVRCLGESDGFWS